MRSDNLDDNPRPIRALLRRLIQAPASLSILWPAILVVCGYLGWHRWGTEHVASKYFHVEFEKIRVTNPPPYVRVNVVETVYYETAMGSLSLMDRQATAKIASAFAMNPWVRNVIGVRKLPGGAIDVRLEYRTPVAMVHVLNPESFDNPDGFLPVDGDGVVVPPDEFAKAEIHDFIHIIVPGINSRGKPLLGQRFGDARVEAAARLAEVLAPFRDKLGIWEIGVHGDPRYSPVPQLEVTQRDGSRFFWGSAPGSERPGEDTVQMKLQRLIAGDSSQDLRMARPGSHLPK